MRVGFTAKMVLSWNEIQAHTAYSGGSSREIVTAIVKDEGKP